MYLHVSTLIHIWHRHRWYEKKVTLRRIQHTRIFYAMFLFIFSVPLCCRCLCNEQIFFAFLVAFLCWDYTVRLRQTLFVSQALDKIYFYSGPTKNIQHASSSTIHLLTLPIRTSNFLYLFFSFFFFSEIHSTMVPKGNGNFLVIDFLFFRLRNE